MKILVTIKQVASLDEDFELRDDGRDVEADFHVFDLNEWDHYALEEAMRLKEGAQDAGVEVVVATVGPDSADEELREVSREGCGSRDPDLERRPRRRGPGRHRPRAGRARAQGGA